MRHAKRSAFAAAAMTLLGIVGPVSAAAVRGTSVHGLAYDLAGTGETVVLIHGAGLDSRMWDAEVVNLARDFTVLRYDLRGYGGSILSGSYSHVMDLRELLDELDLLQVHLVGLSMGGGVALQFSLQYPGRVRSLVLSAPAVPGWVRPPEAGPPFHEAVRAALEGRQEDAIELWLDTPAVRLYSAGEKAREFLRMILRDNPPGRQLRLPPSDPPPGPPAIDRLEEVEAPTLVLVGEHEAADLRELGQILARRIPDAVLIEIDGAGHLPNLDAPEVFVEAIRTFLHGSAP